MFYSSEEKFCLAIVVLIFFAEKFSAGAKILDRLPWCLDPFCSTCKMARFDFPFQMHYLQTSLFPAAVECDSFRFDWPDSNLLATSTASGGDNRHRAYCKRKRRKCSL